MGPFDILSEKHRELEEHLEALLSEEGAAEAEERTGPLAMLIRQHTRLEERHLQPLILRVEGRSRAREALEDHLALCELAEELEEFTPGGPEWQARLTALEDLLVAHAQEQEGALFPRIATCLNEREGEELLRALEASQEDLGRRFGSTAEGPNLQDAPRWGA
ncbi:hemerythrin domain-containing protein [Stigmatella sp. ncwal1]|uniref:Hemerythrin domain-containing protein n=1 Tax=Stigmatella ashevillensis TaxID=2995309 RepID=A0ABT5DGG9_9BACT|nr:hemerythrin domain-containing protein [Stigmatella ashevillena]MDC0712164.1 hemerythrin domain-containing protein [Stigmatella ashevillena]